MEETPHFFESCLHEEIENGVCTLCGLHIHDFFEVDETDYARQHEKPKGPLTTTLEKDVSNMDLDQDVLEWILHRLANSTKNMYKEAMRNNIIFGLIYMAHLSLSKQFDPQALAKRMNLSKPDIETALGLVSGIHPRMTPCNEEGISVSLAIVSPVDIAPGLCEELKLPSQYVPIIQEIIGYCIKADKSLLEEDPRRVSAGAIKYYCEYHRIPVKFKHAIPKIPSTDVKKYKLWVEKSYKKYFQSI